MRNISLRRRFAFFALIVIPALFASNNVAARFADGIVPPTALAFWRCAFTSVLLMPFVGASVLAKRSELRSELPHILVLGLIGMGMVSIATYAGARTTTASNIGLIYASTPAIILVLDWAFTGIRLSRHQLGGLMLCVAGIAFIVLRGDMRTLVDARFSTGDLVVCAGTVGWALYSVLLKYWPTRLTVVERAAVIAAAGALATLPIAIVESHGVAGGAPGWQGLGIVMTVGVLAGAALIPSHAFVTAELGPRIAVVLLYLIPLYNIMLAWLLLDEALEPFQAAGGVLVLIGIFLASRSRPASPPSAAAGASR